MRSTPLPYPPSRWHQSPDPDLRPPGWRGWRRSGPPWQPHPVLSPTPIGPVPAAPFSLANGASRDAGEFPGGGRHREAKARAPERGAHPHTPASRAETQLTLGVSSAAPVSGRLPQSHSQHRTVEMRTPKVAARVVVQGFVNFCHQKPLCLTRSRMPFYTSLHLND